MLENLLFLCLGVAGTILFNYHQRAQQKKDFMNSALAEIHGLKYEMLTTAFRKRQYLRSLDDEFISWCLRIIDGYEELEDTHDIKTDIREMAELSMRDRQGCELFPGEPTAIPTPIDHSLPTITKGMGYLMLCPMVFQNLINKILSHLHTYNQHVASQEAYMDKASAASTDQQINTMRSNLDAGYTAIAHSARMFVEVADDLEGHYG